MVWDQVWKGKGREGIARHLSRDLHACIHDEKGRYESGDGWMGDIKYYMH